MDIRKRILDELKRQDKSRYWLGLTVAKAGKANRETVFRYLRGARDTSGEVIGAMLDALGLHIDALGEHARMLRTTVTPQARPALAAAKRKRTKARASR